MIKHLLCFLFFLNVIYCIKDLISLNNYTRLNSYYLVLVFNYFLWVLNFYKLSCILFLKLVGTRIDFQVRDN